MEIVLVEWKDITAEMGNWIKAEAIAPEMSVVVSVGILVSENDEFIVLAADYSEDKHFNGLNYIPKVLVTRRQPVAKWTGNWPDPKPKKTRKKKAPTEGPFSF